MSNKTTGQHTFKEGDHVLFIDRRGRRYLVKLEQGHRFVSHVGGFDHVEVIGKQIGSRLTTNKGHRVLALNPTMADFTRLMPRTATVVYPKDLGAILVQGDIFPGAKVLEAGSGSGALTIALMRAVGEHGTVVSYDVREDMLERAKNNVEQASLGIDNLIFKHGDVNDPIEEADFDRVVFDLPEPWSAVAQIEKILVPGGILLCFLPTILQVHELCRMLLQRRVFDLVETMELMMRPWSVGGRSVRPDHRMVAHTGFIVTARLCEARPPGQNECENRGELQEPEL